MMILEKYVTEDGAELALHMVPENLRGGLSRYVWHGIEPGSFLCAVIENDLAEAVGRTSDYASIPPVVRWLYNWAPSPCWGSKEKRIEWQRMHAEARKKAG